MVRVVGHRRVPLEVFRSEPVPTPENHTREWRGTPSLITMAIVRLVFKQPPYSGRSAFLLAVGAFGPANVGFKHPEVHSLGSRSALHVGCCLHSDRSGAFCFVFILWFVSVCLANRAPLMSWVRFDPLASLEYPTTPRAKVSMQSTRDGPNALEIGHQKQERSHPTERNRPLQALE